MPMILRAHYYQQFDADSSLDVPAEGYGGWKQADIEIDAGHTAVVLMHAWNTGKRERCPGWYRAVEYLPRADVICREVLPPLLGAVRSSEVRLFHVVGGGDYYRGYPGYARAVELAGPDPGPPEQVRPDPALERLREFRAKHVFVGEHNRPDVDRGFAALDFAEQARPMDDEGIAENGRQLLALCRDAGVNHLIYAGFAVNWCLLLSPGGMAEMSRHGIMCSVLRQAVTAVENRETARDQLCKQIALWRVAVAFGFVFDVDDFVRALRAALPTGSR